VAHNELSFAAYCDGRATMSLARGSDLQFVAFNVPAAAASR